MKTYQSHQQVEAAKIRDLIDTSPRRETLDVYLVDALCVQVERRLLAQCQARVGDYLVRDCRGQFTVLPRRVFEQDYSEVVACPQAPHDSAQPPAPPVTPDQIETLMQEVQYHSCTVPGTATTVVVAVVEGGFTLATAVESAPLGRECDAADRLARAREKARRAARWALWALAGYCVQPEGERCAAGCRPTRVGVLPAGQR